MAYKLCGRTVIALNSAKHASTRFTHPEEVKVLSSPWYSLCTEMVYLSADSRPSN